MKLNHAILICKPLIFRRDHHALDAQLHQRVEEAAIGLGLGVVEQRAVGRDSEAAFQRRFDRLHRDFIDALAADGFVVLGFGAIQMHRERQVLRGLEAIEMFFEQDRVRAKVDVLLASDETFNDLMNLRMQQWFAAGDRDHWCPAFFDRLKALLGREVLSEHGGGMLNLAAAGAGQVAAKQRFEHQHKLSLGAWRNCTV